MIMIFHFTLFSDLKTSEDVIPRNRRFLSNHLYVTEYK